MRTGRRTGSGCPGCVRLRRIRSTRSLALRVASLPLPDDEQRRLVDALFAATWANGRGVETEEAVTAAANDAGLDGAALVRAAGEPETKARLRAATEESGRARRVRRSDDARRR